MRIYLNGNEIQCEVLPLETQTQDETLDTLSFSLVSDQATQYAPMQSLSIENDDGSVDYFVLTADSVEPMSLKIGKYRHSITCVESTRELSKHMVRNSVFSQPASPFKVGHCLLSSCASPRVQEGTEYYYEDKFTQLGPSKGRAIPISLSAREKCSRAFLTLDAQFAVMPLGDSMLSPATVNSDCKTLQEISDLVPSPSYITSDLGLEIVYTKNGVSDTEPLTASGLGSGQILFNTQMECPRIAELLNDGYAVHVRPTTDYMFSTKMYYGSTTHIPFFTVDFKIKAETYYHTAYDVLDLLIKRQRLTRVSAGTEIGRPDLFSLPQSGELYDLLKRTIAPNFIFTQNTMYECVAEVFRLFDAIFTMDGNKVLGITYFNDRGEDVSPKITGRVVALGEERRANGLISYYQDARQELTFPSELGYAPPRSSRIGVPAQGDHDLVVNFPIDSVIECMMQVTFTIMINVNPGPASSFDNKITVQNYKLDVTRYIWEESLWSGYLDTTSTLQTADPGVAVQNNSVYFSKGDNKVKLGYTYTASWGVTYYPFGNMMNCALWYALGWQNVSNTSDNKVIYPNSSTPDWELVKMRLKYYASLDGRLKIESIENKYDGDMVVDQSNGAVDLNKLGLNILGLSLKMGEPSFQANVKPTTWANRIKKGDVLTFNNQKWIANVCSYTFIGNGLYKGSVSFVKNYNELSLRKTLLREKRLSNVSKALTQKSEDNLIEYCYYSTEEDDMGFAGAITAFGSDLEKGVALSFGASVDGLVTLDYCYLEGANRIYLPCHRYGAGNTINFEMSFSDNMSAGIQTTQAPSSSWLPVTSYWSQYVLYTDGEGFADELTIRLAKNQPSQGLGPSFPKIGTNPDHSFSIDNLKVYKQPNEIFALNYAICFLPRNADRDFLGSEFINKNFLVDGLIKERKLYIHVSNNYRYSVLDTKAHGEIYEEVNAVTYISGNYASIEFAYDPFEGYDVYSWAITDEDGNILFASNNGGNGGYNYKRVYFKGNRNRLE